MIKIPETSPCYFTNQIEKKLTHPAALTPVLAFKNPSLKATGDFRAFEHEPLTLLAGHPTNKWCAFL